MAFIQLFADNIGMIDQMCNPLVRILMILGRPISARDIVIAVNRHTEDNMIKQLNNMLAEVRALEKKIADRW